MPSDKDLKNGKMDLIGLGRFSSHKSYYPELQKKIKELEEEKERYKSLFENVISGILRIDENGNLLDCNTAAAKIFNFENVENAMKKREAFIFNYISEEKIKEMKYILEKENKISGFEIQVSIGDIKKWLRFNISMLKRNNTFITYDIICEDITINYEYRKKLEFSERRYRELFERSPLSISVYDNEGNTQSYNDAFLKLWNISKEFAEKNMGKYNLFKDDSHWTNGVIEQINKVLEGEEADSIEIRYEVIDDFAEDQNGEYSAWVKVHFFGSENIDGKIDQIFILQEDITKRINAQIKLIELNNSLERRVKMRTEELEKINNELRDFAYVVSHDLKAPLRGITQVSSWLYEDYHDKLDDEGKQMLDLILDRSKKMEILINGILEYSRAGRKVRDYEKVDLNLVLSETLKIFNEIKNYEVKTDHLPVISAEKIKMEQIFQNLISNSVKYMDKDNPKIVIRTFEKDGYQVFKFCDNGCGIAEKYHKKVFEMFQTLDTSDKNRSSGIGLAIVKKIIENYGGNIELKSEIGKGTCISFGLPFERLEN